MFFLVRIRSWTFQITSLNKIIADKNVHAQHILPLELMDKTNSTYYVFCRKCVNLSSSCRKLFGIDQKGGNAISYTINDICNKYLYMLNLIQSKKYYMHVIWHTWNVQIQACAFRHIGMQWPNASHSFINFEHWDVKTRAIYVCLCWTWITDVVLTCFIQDMSLVIYTSSRMAFDAI